MEMRYDELAPPQPHGIHIDMYIYDVVHESIATPIVLRFSYNAVIVVEFAEATCTYVKIVV